jgi:hypothetical protein
MIKIIDKEATSIEAETQAVLDHFATGKPLDPEIARRVRARGQKIREEIYQQHGILDIGVPAIRELRGELPKP